MRSFISLKFLKYYIFYILIYSLIFLPIFLNKGVPVGNDWGVPEYSNLLQNWFKSGLYSWTDGVNFLGERMLFNTHLLISLIGYFLSYFFNISGALYFKMLIFFSFLIGGISAFNLFVKYGLSKLGSFIGGIVFTLNPVTFNFLLMGWNFVLLSVFLAPLFIFFLNKYIETKKKIYLLISASIYAFSFIESQSIVYYSIIFLIYFLCSTRRLSFKNLFFILKSFIFLLILAFLLHCFWLLPLIIYKDSYVAATVAKIDILRFSLRSSALNMIRGWGSTFNYQFETAYLNQFILFSFTFPFIFFLNLIKTQQYNGPFLFYIILSFLPLVFYLINKYLHFIPYSNILRDFNRSFPYLFLTYACFVARFFTFLSKEKIRFQKIIQVFLFLFVLLGLHPFVLGSLYCARENKVGISDREVDQRLRLFQSEKEINNFDITISNQKILTLNEKALLLPTGSAYIYPDRKEFNGMWASISDNYIFFSNNIRGIFITGNSSKFMTFLADKIAEPFEFKKKCDSINDVFWRSVLLSKFKYFIVKNKTINVFHNINAKQVNNCFNKHKTTFIPIFKNEDITIYKANSSYFLPHFYIPQNIIYSNGSIEDLPEIVGLPDYQLRSGIYLGKINGLTDLKINELKRRVDEVVVVGRLENGVDKDYFERLEGFKNNVTFPYVKHQPGSFGWKLARLKEKYEEWKVRKEPEKLIDKKLYFAGKRIAEVEKFKDIKDIEYLILNTYKVKIEGAVKEIEKLGNLEIKKYQVIKLRAYLEKHEEKINGLFINELTDSRLKAWEEVFDELDGEIRKMEKRFDLNNFEYKLEVPKEGEYTVYLEIPNAKFQTPDKSQILNYNNREIEKLGSWEIEGIEIDGERLDKELEKEEQWVRLGKVRLGKGEHKLTLHLLEGENLVGEEWQELKNEKATDSGKVKLSVQGLFPQAEGVVFQPIKNWEPGSLYYLSFEYKTEGGSLGVSILEDIKDIKDTGDIEYLSKTEKILDKKLKSWKIEKIENWEKFETILPADINTLGAKIYFYSQPEPNKIANVEFRNVKIEKIREPKIILRAKINNLYKTDIPKITFVKINPTKYRVKVEGAKNPYTLVFSESFHKGWKLYINELTDSKINELKNYGEEVASYFDGEIKEGTHKNIFLDRNTFETWEKKPIAEDRHYLVNGYANSWYITPEDTKGAENYELIVEFWPQRLFYIGLFISIMTLIGCTIYLVIPLIKRVI